MATEIQSHGTSRELHLIDDSDDFDSFLPFGDQEVDSFRHGFQQEVTATMIGMLAYRGISRSDFSKKIGWKKSRITALLSGDSNPTAKILHEFCSALNFRLNVTVTEVGAPRPLQPWEINGEDLGDRPSIELSVNLSKSAFLLIKSFREVQEDFSNGKGSTRYIEIGERINHQPVRVGYLDALQKPDSLSLTGTSGSYILSQPDLTKNLITENI